MKWDKLGKVVARAAPLLGSLLPIPGGAALGGLIAGAFGGNPNDPAELAKLIEADPDSAVKLKQIEAAHRERAMVVSSRLAAMGTLAAGIAHEINNPIGGMLNAVHSLKKRGDLGQRSVVYLDLLLEGLDRVGAIARKVLDFSPRQIEAAPFDLADAVGVERLERIVLQDSQFDVFLNKGARVVAAEPVHHLREIVRAEAEKIGDRGDVLRGNGGPRNLDHRSDVINEFGAALGDNRVGDIDDPGSQPR